MLSNNSILVTNGCFYAFSGVETSQRSSDAPIMRFLLPDWLNDGSSVGWSRDYFLTHQGRPRIFPLKQHSRASETHKRMKIHLAQILIKMIDGLFKHRSCIPIVTSGRQTELWGFLSALQVSFSQRPKLLETLRRWTIDGCPWHTIHSQWTSELENMERKE